ncbi:ABC-three component system protein [Flavobacterium limnophilum]|uniref:ABC-three component system protein n=1 Tax=Flavobacterium limnophilum TaxID=3003262 RepID=UPI0022AC33C4|nr:ABC-three component system protein [Flavobacterium limnophilum]
MSQKYYSKLRFSLNAIKSEGQKYEDLFNDVMIASRTGFRRVKAYGNIGDRKNDGFVPATGVYFQVFAPEDINNERTVVSAVSKLEEDFTKLLEHWNEFTPIKEFYFVLNDKQKGSPPPVEQKMAKLCKLHPDISFGTYTMDDLISEFMELDIEKQESIIGFIPSPNKLQTISVSALSTTIEHLISLKEVKDKPNDNFDLEEFNNKIVFNFLDNRIAQILEKAETQTYIIDEYFTRNQNKRLGEIIRNSLNYIYETEKEKYGGVVTVLNSAIIFYNILDICAVEKGDEAINSSLVLMSFFFTSCDIFEKPTKD